jgi:hypothetical protein
VVLGNLLVSLCKFLKHLLSELVNGLVHLASVWVWLIFEHIAAVELDAVAKHPNSLFRVETGVHPSRVLCLLKVRNVCCARSFAQQIVVTVLDLLVFLLLLGLWTLQGACLTKQTTSRAFSFQR